MKKHIAVITLMVAAMFFTSCGAKVPLAEVPLPEPVADEPSGMPSEPAVVDEPSFEIRTISESMAGDGEYIYADDISSLSFVNEDNIPVSLPVFVNKFPAGNGGALYTVDQSLLDDLKENLRDFLGILYDERGTPEYDIQQKDDVGIGMVSYNTGAAEINSKPGGLSTITSEYGIASDIKNGNILENKMIQTGLKYIGIDSPKVSTFMNFKTSGEFYYYTYTITETTNDFLENAVNNSCSYVKTSYGPGSSDSSGLLLQIVKMDTSEKYSEETILPYQEALAYVQNLYGMEDSSRIYAEMYYSTNAELGFFIPCYKFYIDTGETDLAGNSTKYDIVRIPAASVQ